VDIISAGTKIVRMRVQRLRSALKHGVLKVKVRFNAMHGLVHVPSVMHDADIMSAIGNLCRTLLLLLLLLLLLNGAVASTGTASPYIHCRHLCDAVVVAVVKPRQVSHEGNLYLRSFWDLLAALSTAHVLTRSVLVSMGWSYHIGTLVFLEPSMDISPKVI
jgi:hypothetical protein